MPIRFGPQVANKRAELAINLEQLKQIREKTAAESEAANIASTSYNTTPMSTEMGGMNVNLGSKKEFDPDMYYNRLASSGNPALIDKANKFKDDRIKLEEQTQDVLKKRQENSILGDVNRFTAIDVSLGMAEDDPQAATGYLQNHLKDFPEMGQVLNIQPIGNGKFKIDGVGPDNKSTSQVFDRQRVTEMRASADTRWQQYNENLRNEARLNKEQTAKEKEKQGPEYIDVESEGKAGRMKTTELQTIWKNTHPKEAMDDLSYSTKRWELSQNPDKEAARAAMTELDTARATAEHNFATWAWNTYKADPLGLIKSGQPIHWMGDKDPPAALMRGKVRKDNATGKWFVSDGKSWVKPSAEQQKQIDAKLKSQ